MRMKASGICFVTGLVLVSCFIAIHTKRLSVYCTQLLASFVVPCNKQTKSLDRRSVTPV